MLIFTTRNFQTRVFPEAEKISGEVIAIKWSFLMQTVIMALAIPFNFLRSKRNSLRFPALGE
ncbi:MAG: hypothetical protein QXM43_08430 [Desulfurococcaceae archaeon]